MRQFDTFSKSLSQVDSRVQFLDQLASRLITEKHMEAKSVAQINENVQEAQRKLHVSLYKFFKLINFRKYCNINF
jgi:hypothetical protein